MLCRRLQLSFLDLRPPKPSSKVLAEVNFRALLGYLAETQELDSDFIAKFLNDEDLIFKAERVYRLTSTSLKGDALVHVQITVRDKMNAVVVLRQVLAEIWLTCDQISRLVSVCNKSGLVGPVIAVEVAVMLWSRCIDRSEWNIVMNKLSKKSQVGILLPASSIVISIVIIIIVIVIVIVIVIIFIIPITTTIIIVITIILMRCMMFTPDCTPSIHVLSYALVARIIAAAPLYNIIIASTELYTHYVQVKVGQTIGYAAIVNPMSPDMHYCLRMYRSDELHVSAVN